MPVSDLAAPYTVADVVVNTPVSRAGGYMDTNDIFSYEIPLPLQGQIKPGHLVWAPFSGRRLQGIVVGLRTDAPPGVTLRALAELAAAEPVLSAAQLDLARWLSQRYLAPLRECLFLMLPAGVAQRVDVVLSRQGAGPLPDDLSAEQRALLLRLQLSDAAQRVLKKENPAWGQSRVLQPLLRRGLLTRRNAVTSPTVRPLTQQLARLLADAETFHQALLTLGRRSKQADALFILAHHTPAVLAMDALQKLAGCGPGPLQALADRGSIRIVSAPDAHGRQVSLALTPAEADAAVISLRGGEKYQRVLAVLRESTEPLWVGRVLAAANVDMPTLRELVGAGLIALESVEVMRDPLAGRAFVQQTPPRLTAEQEKAWAAIETALIAPPTANMSSRSFLLFGVTGSGKTEIYLRAIAAALAQGKQAIVLVPEIALTPQTIARFAVRFPNRIAVWHSDLSAGERFDTWRRIRRGELPVVIGPRSALFAPLTRVGVIIMDEEHDSSYKEHERQPRYQARAVALRLGQLTGATVILGSATPALETFYAAQRGQLQLLSLYNRVMGHRSDAEGADVQPQTMDLPEVTVVDLRQELRAGNRSILSRALQSALQQTLAAGEQAILFLNRRGNATVVMCRDCGHVEQCSRCELPMTYHGPLAEQEQPAETILAPQAALRGQQLAQASFLLCHQCNRRRPVPTTCPACGSLRIRYLGVGTQRVEQAVREQFAQARTLRWDRDTTQHKGAHAEILEQFSSRQANVLIGTQMIAKGLDLPMVTLVGVISADMGLYLPDPRAAEHTFQVLMQVAGRAGRSARGGQVIVQTYTPDHYTVSAASQHDYLSFFRRELDYRRQLDYPPLTRLVRLVYSHSSAEQAEAETQRVARLLQGEISRLGMTDVGVIGPAPCFFARLRYRYRWHILVRGRGSDPSAVVRPLTLPAGWHIDVDPINLL